ncbi:hypothetical protein N9N65_03985 [Amylibacter sp.]|nr:hypothetical protein [Amylibacter sp.]
MLCIILAKLASGSSPSNVKITKSHGFMKVRLPNGQKYDGVWHNGDLQEAFSIQKNSHDKSVNHIH